MGGGPSKAKEKAKEKNKEAKTELDTLMTDLSNKLKTFESKVKSSRGKDISTTEVDGGRSVMRVSEIRVSTGNGVNNEIKDAIGSFIKLAQGGEEAKDAAVEGAESLLCNGIDALFGVSKGTSMEKQGFMCMFLNFAFVRVDFYIYSYCVSGAQWGAKSSTSGSCYLADLAVLKLDSLSSSEIDFLISQSLKSKDMSERVNTLTALKLQLTQSAVLSRLLRDKDGNADLEQVKEATEKYVQSQAEIKKIWKSMPPFIPASQ